MSINARKLKQLGSKIKKLRKQKNMTQEELAEKIRVTGSYVGFIEQGLRHPSLATADKIARVLGVKLSELLEE